MEQQQEEHSHEGHDHDHRHDHDVHEVAAHADPHADTHAEIQHDAHSPDAHGDGHESGGPVDWPMFFWFLVIFGIAAAILKKKAFGPILDGLDAREAEIAQSLDDADTIKRELAQLESTVNDKIAEADAQASDLVEQGRKGGKEIAANIENQAKEQAKITTENAQRDIATAREKAAASLRQESADVAVTLASKLLNEKLDDAGRKALTDRLISEM